MQTIKVTVSTKDNVTAFRVDNKTVGSFTAAIEALTDCVDEYFRNVGVNVTFI